ncbi:flavodoxin family protein [Kitasatospora cineracea]|uniref:Flavodoxin-like protein n=1 Tax=Kitasatospora cineracea TaxID=88074 RepID=A0A8G1UKA5_9ACTN|nr:flavodoxin domain-containing protein [Kitasatospora cineracea]ROR45580.1 flavodoxin-like protein [Kitasatospora cineracea]
MRAVIVYETSYGNTGQVAAAIAEGVRRARPDAEVRCLPVAEAGARTVEGADLLVVGGPTHMRGMSTRLSRTLAAKAGAPERGPGLRSWLRALPDGGTGARAAAFDTRAGAAHAGAAADGIATRLARHHWDLAAEPAGFLVEETGGPLREGEAVRAEAWGAALV